MPFHLWNARLFHRFVTLLKRLGCHDEYLTVMPDCSAAMKKTLAALEKTQWENLEDEVLCFLEENLLNLRNLCILIGKENKLKESNLLTAQTEKTYRLLLSAIASEIANRKMMDNNRQMVFEVC